MGWQERKEGGNSAPTTASIKITLRPTGFSIQSSSSDDYFISSPVGCTSSHGRNTKKKIRGADTIVELEQMDRRSTKSRAKKQKVSSASLGAENIKEIFAIKIICITNKRRSVRGFVPFCVCYHADAFVATLCAIIVCEAFNVERIRHTPSLNITSIHSKAKCKKSFFFFFAFTSSEIIDLRMTENTQRDFIRFFANEWNTEQMFSNNNHERT